MPPGGGFCALAFIEASVAFLGYGLADGAHTLSVEFTAGDASLLTPWLRPVPEPQALARMACGLLALMALARRRLPR